MIFDPGVRGALLRYRVMAYVVGTGLIVLVFVGLPLQWWGHNRGVVEVVGPLHGFLYIVYLFFALDLWRRARWSLIRIVAMVAAGFLPGLAFYMERQMTRRFTAEEEDEPDTAAVARGSGSPGSDG